MKEALDGSLDVFLFPWGWAVMVFLCWIGILGGLGLAWLVGSLWMAISVIQCGEGD